MKKFLIKNHHQEIRLFQRRALALLAIFLLITITLIFRLSYLQIIKHKDYSTLSKNNIVNVIPIQPNRGLIYDRNGVLLAKNVPAFNLNVLADRIKDVDKTLQELQTILPVTTDDISSFKKQLKQHRPFQSIPLLYNLNPSELAVFYVNQYRFPGVSVQMRTTRAYPENKNTAFSVGHVGRINTQDLKQMQNSANYIANNYIGKTGIEKEYENILHGTTGSQEVETNANGHIIRTLTRTPSTPGSNLYLTIDSRLQQVAHQALGSARGAVVAIQPSTGEVLALLSNPSYDPNVFVGGLSNKVYQQLINSPAQPLFNRATQGMFSIASTIKPFFALAALDLNVISPDFKIFDPGWYKIPNTDHVYHDWKRSGHGWVDVSKAIMVSCDTFFYSIANKLGIARMDTALSLFGFGEKTGIDLPSEQIGVIPSPEWKMNKTGTPWYGGDSVITSIGQGYMLATPLQLAEATAILANRGKHLTPTLLKKTITPNEQSIIQPPQEQETITIAHQKYWGTVIDAMEEVVKNPLGTGEHFGRHPRYTIAAKTGTAQVHGHNRNEESQQTNIPYRLRNNHLFIAFAPVKNPKIAIAIVVEHDALAAKVARKILDYYLTEEPKILAQSTKNSIGNNS